MERLNDDELRAEFKRERERAHPDLWSLVMSGSGAYYLIVGKDPKLGFEVENLDDYTGIRPKEGLYIGNFNVVTEDHIAKRYENRIKAIIKRRTPQNEI